jgi:excisionase family DNA binding protein
MTPEPFSKPKFDIRHPDPKINQKRSLFTLEERLYTSREVAVRLGVSERWVRDHATRRNPLIRAIKLGPLVRFRESDVAAFVAAQVTDSSRLNHIGHSLSAIKARARPIPSRSPAALIHFSDFLLFSPF